MLLLLLLILPVSSAGLIYTTMSYDKSEKLKKIMRKTGLFVSLTNFLISLLIFLLFDFSSNNYQFVQEYHEFKNFDFYLGVDGLSIYFVMLTTLITPIAILSNWTSIKVHNNTYIIILLLLESFLLAVFMVLDILLFYIFLKVYFHPYFCL